MSVINRVLKDLDQKGTAPTPLSGVQAVQTSLAASRPRWPWLVLLLLIGGLAVAWWFWPVAIHEEPAAPLAVADATPRLRLSETLSSPTASPPPDSGAETAATAVETSVRPEPTKPAIAKPEPTRELQHDAHRNFAAVPSPALASIAARLDTRLPEPRQPKVSKEVRPLTPREQAEQAWRQAAHQIEQGRGRDALEGLEAVLRLDPNHGQARQTLIALSLEAGDMAHDVARGEALLREGMQLHTNDAWYNRALSQLYLQRGDLRLSAATLKAGLGKHPDAAYWGLYAGVLGKSGQPEEAVQAYREAARLNPNHGPWWIGLAVSLEQTGQRPDAAAAYQRALQTKLGAEVREFAIKKAGELGP
ncbi:MAG: tetratricopeptide repeat protein [Gammaproteobacteria bacterium]|nr:tetratricopeptide repeat protein [Gammaproteobacteria bacterium]